MKNEKGQAMVEFALLVPVLLLIISGIVDFGWIFYNIAVTNNACREGARYAAINYEKDDYDLNAFITPRLPAALSSVAISVEDENPTVNDITVNITARINVLTPHISLLFNGRDADNITPGVQLEIPLKSTMRKE